MGNGRSNITPKIHMCEAVVEDVRINIHDSATPTDTTSPSITKAQFNDLIIGAGTSQAAMESEIDDIGGTFETWYGTLSSKEKSDLCWNLSACPTW